MPSAALGISHRGISYDGRTLLCDGRNVGNNEKGCGRSRTFRILKLVLSALPRMIHRQVAIFQRMMRNAAMIQTQMLFPYRWNVKGRLRNDSAI